MSKNPSLTQISYPIKSNIRHRLLSGGFWVISGKGFSMIVGIAISAYLTRVLSPNDMGAYFLTFSLVTTAAAFGQFGLPQTSTRLIAESMGMNNSKRTKFVISYSLKVGVIISSFVALILVAGVGKWIVEHWQFENMHAIIVPTSILVIIFSLRAIVGEIFRGFHDIRLATIFSGLASDTILVVCLLIIWMLKISVSLEQIITLLVVIGGISLSISILILIKRVNNLEIQGQNDLTGTKILTISWPLLITSFTFIILTQADLWILGVYSSQEDVALYGAVLRLVTKISMPLLLVSAILPPMISEMHAQNKHIELEKMLRTTATIAGWPAILILLIIVVFSRPILENLYGDFYGDGALILAVLCIGQLVNIWSGSCGLVLIMTGFQKTVMYISLFSGMFMILGLLLVVNRFGLLSVAIVASLSVVVRNILMVVLAYKKTGIWTNMALIPDWQLLFRR